MDQWFNKKFCDRCGKSLADGFSMSRFDTSALCFDCLAEERQHPDYQKTVDAELAALPPAIVTWLVSDGLERMDE